MASCFIAIHLILRSPAPWSNETLPGSLSASLRVVVGANTSVAEDLLWDTARYCKHEVSFHASNNGLQDESTWLIHDWHWLWKPFSCSWFESIPQPIYLASQVPATGAAHLELQGFACRRREVRGNPCEFHPAAEGTSTPTTVEWYLPGRCGRWCMHEYGY